MLRSPKRTKMRYWKTPTVPGLLQILISGERLQLGAVAFDIPGRGLSF